MSMNDYLKSSRILTKKYSKNVPKKLSFIDIIKKRIERDMDTRIIIAGESGIGKSTLALCLAELLDSTYVDKPDYAVKHLVTFDTLEYMKAVNSNRAGSVLIMDEAGQAIHHRLFMNSINIILSKTMIGNRFKQLIQVFCVPNLEMIDKDCRNLVHYLLYVDKRGCSIVYRVITSRFGGATVFKKIRDHLYFNKPNLNLWNSYEDKKFKIQKELFEEFQKEMETQRIIPISNNELVIKVRSNPEAFKKNDVFNVRSLQGLGIGRDRAETIRSMLSNID